MHNVNLITYNCKNIKRSIEGIKQLCSLADIIALQETWLQPEELPFLSSVHEDFGSTGTSAMDTAAGIIKGRPFGGVALLWRKSVFPCVSVIPCSNPRIAAICLTTNGRPVLVVSVYMPTDCIENVSEFTDCLSCISAIISESDIESVFILGDYNAHPGERFYRELIDFSMEQDWTCVDTNRLQLSSGTFTFISEAHGSTRWLDHCLVTDSAMVCITDVTVKYDVYWSDHLPLVISCDLDVIRQKKTIQKSTCNKINWGERNADQCYAYGNMCNSQFKLIDLLADLQKCCGKYCSDHYHKEIINNLYSDIVKVLRSCAIATYDSSRGKRKPLAGWNKHVSEAHRNARLEFNVWCWYGQPSTGPIFDAMMRARKIFKGKLKWCQKHQEQIKMDLLAKHHAKSDFKGFWKATSRLNPKPGVPVSVDGHSCPRDIAELFKKQFAIESPLGPPCGVFDAGPENAEVTTVIRAKEIRHILRKMTRGKSPGHDGLSIEHLQHAGPHLPRVLALLFNLCLSHSHLPPDLVRTLVVPVIKSKTGDVSDKSNYRPISLATVIAKVLDSVLNSHLNKHVQLCDAQFGFRPGLSTETAIVSLKHAVRYYTARNTPVYAVFLDLSRAFDLVPYDLLWKKLDETTLPPEFTLLLRHWYLNQETQVRWAGELSEPCRPECGVRQGGLSSPLLFGLYVNALIERLSSTRIGCYVDGVCFNNISYADDMVLLAPSIGALRKLLNVCESYAVAHGLSYNSSKTEFMVFRSGTRCPTTVPPLYIKGQPIDRVYKFKYLGHLVTDDLKDDLDLERERRALSVRANMLARRFSRCTVAIKIVLFKAYCTSLYSGALWFTYTQKAYNALRVQYNNAFRALLRLPRFCSASAMFAEARTESFDALWRKKSASLLHRLRGSPNTILQSIAARADSPLLWALTNRTRSVLVIKY